MTTNVDAYLAELGGQITTGLPDDFTGTIVNARFAIPMGENMDNPRLSFICDIHTDDPDLGNNGVLEDQTFGIGDGWTKVGKGESVEREDGKKAAFNTNSKIGRLVGSLLAQDSFKAALGERVASGDAPLLNEAAFYEGITGHWKRNEASFKTKEGNEMSYSFFTIDEFVSFGKAAAKPAKKAAKAPAKKAAKSAAKAAPKPAPEPEPEETDGETGDDVTRAALTQLLEIATAVINDGGDHDDFMTRALEEVDGADSDDFIMDAIADPDKVWNVAIDQLEES